jgi:hypothetical protein
MDWRIRSVSNITVRLHTGVTLARLPVLLRMCWLGVHCDDYRESTPRPWVSIGEDDASADSNVNRNREIPQRKALPSCRFAFPLGIRSIFSHPDGFWSLGAGAEVDMVHLKNGISPVINQKSASQFRTVHRRHEQLTGNGM